MAFKSTAGTSEYENGTSAQSYIPKAEGKKTVLEKLRETYAQRQIAEQAGKTYIKNLRQEKWKTLRRAVTTPSRINQDVQNLVRKQVAIRGKDGRIYYVSKLRGTGRASPRMIRAANLIAAEQIPGGNLTTGKSSGTGKAGRPKGTYDLRYAQFGGVYGYRKYQSYQRRLAIMKAREQMKQSMQQQGRMSQQYTQQPQQAQYQEEMPQQVQQQPVQQPQPKPKTGVSLWDNSFMKLDSGQGAPVEKIDAFNPQTPMGDKDGDFYTEPDFFSGKQVLRRRSQDKLFKW